MAMTKAVPKLPKSHPLACLPVPCPLDRTFKNAKEVILTSVMCDGNTFIKCIKEKNEEKKEEKVHVKVVRKNNFNAFSCVCGGELKKIKFNIQKTCSHCCNPINVQSNGYRCDNGKLSVHKLGFYICSECGEYIKHLKKHYGQSIIKYKKTRNSTPKSATHWIWCLVGGRYGSKQDDAAKKLFKKGMTNNLDLIEEHIKATNLAKAKKRELINNAVYRRLFEPGSLTKKQVLLTIEMLLSWCCQISSISANNLCGAVIYYTGHGRNNGNWLLQGGDISFEDIYDVVVNFRFLWQQLRLVFIIECCYGGAWCKKLASMYDVYPSTKQIIIMASADENNKVSFTENGAYFTRYVLGIDEKLPEKAPVPYYCAYQSKTSVFSNNTNVKEWKDGHVAQQK